MQTINATLEIIGVNPYVSLPDEVLTELFVQAGKDKGPIPIKGSINEKAYRQTLVKYSGEWRLYINTTMLKNSPKRIGEIVELTVQFDSESREIKSPLTFDEALSLNQEAQAVFNKLPASEKLEIVRYLANLKTEESLDRNIIRAINFLTGNGRFVGREKPSVQQ